MPQERRTINDNDDPRAESNQHYRSIADGLIKRSTYNGSLSLDALRTNTADTARDIVFRQHGVALATRNGGVGEYVDDQIRNLTLATREVLGIVPQNQWKHNASSYLIQDFASWVSAQFGGEYEPTHGLTCRQNGRPIGYVDPNASLASQNVSCAIPPRPRGR